MGRSSAKKSDFGQGQEAYNRLIGEIQAGKLRPNDRLTETELAARFGTSRTPIREAIRLLETDGLVVHVPRVGAVVRSLDYAEITELYEMRTVLEGTAARFAARAATDVELAELEAINAEMARAKSEVLQLYKLNRQFHAALMCAAKNRFLVKSAEAVEKTLLILGRSTMEEGERANEAIAEHGEVLKALHARNGEQAETHMRRHIEAAHRARLRQLHSRADA